jgi:hypothetical protein
MSSFKAWFQEEPGLIFGRDNICVDPKTGLSLYGPYYLSDQEFPTPLEIRIGIVGSGETISLAKKFIKKCSNKILSQKKNKILSPSFPGISLNTPFRCKLLTSETWEDVITQAELDKVKDIPDFGDRMRYAVGLFVDRMNNLSGKTPSPNVIICALPKIIVDYCASYVDRFGRTKRYRYTEFERELQKMKEKGQRSLDSFFPEPLSLDIIEAKEKHFTNFRRALKAETMHTGIPIQLIQESTLANTLEGKGDIQDEATVAWNFCVAMYYKGGGYPWKLAGVDQNTCYIGISFYQGIESISMHTSIAQMFSDTGEGLVMKGIDVKWDRRQGRTPHLTKDSARKLLSDAIDFFKKNTKINPTRVVVHKTSRYWPDELEGLKLGIDDKKIHSKDFVTIEKRGIRFARIGNFPPIRGTVIQLPNKNILLYTRGYIPYQQTYPGLRVPRPIELLEHHGDSTPDKICKEILGLTKLNWNNADFAGSMPITLAFSRRVGEVLSHKPKNPRPEYKFYM